MTVPKALLLDILDGLGESFYALDAQWRVTVFNAGAESHFGLSRGEILGRTIWEAVPGSYDTPIGELFRQVMASRQPALDLSYSLIKGGAWMEGRLFPLSDGGIGVAFRDVSERKRHEAEMLARQAELANVQRIAGFGGLEVDLRRGFVNRRSAEYLALHGLPPEAATESHEDWVRRIHPEDREDTERAFRDAVKGGALSYAAEYRIVRPDTGEVRWIAATAEIERDAAGRALRLVGAHRDVTERKRLELRQRLLINELNHRVKNTLATVQSIAALSLRGARTTDHAWRAFESRLFALSRAHDILTRENWESVELHDIVLKATEPYRSPGPERFRIEGQRARLRPQAALALAMALQELATNAVKYGALSCEGGAVEILWSEGAGRAGSLNFRWVEAGGPAVETPRHRGFGSRLIERSLPSDLGGSVRLDFAPSGVTCTLTLDVGAAASHATTL